MFSSKTKKASIDLTWTLVVTIVIGLLVLAVYLFNIPKMISSLWTGASEQYQCEGDAYKNYRYCAEKCISEAYVVSTPDESKEWGCPDGQYCCLKDLDIT